eukprot:s4816_g2.t1
MIELLFSACRELPFHQNKPEFCSRLLQEDFTPLRIAFRFVNARLKELDYHRKRLADGRRGLWNLRGVVQPKVEAEVLRVLLANPCEERVINFG